MDGYGRLIGDDVGKQVISDVPGAWQKAAGQGIRNCTTNPVGM
jgi:hypothetical protein